MKTIGLLGGMSWESTASYYDAINAGVNERLGGLHSAKLCLYSVDFQEIEKLQQQGNWQACAEILADAARSIESAGAEFLLICTNTMHLVAPEIESAISIPLIHIADATGEKLVADQVQEVGLLGTRFTMEHDFYKNRLKQKFGIEVLIPERQEREFIHEVIYHELCVGRLVDSSRQKYIEVIESLRVKGVQAVILGCTEIALLVQQAHTSLKLYDTTRIHAEKAVDIALSSRPLKNEP